jgi:hypothetical protein
MARSTSTANKDKEDISDWLLFGAAGITAA